MEEVNFVRDMIIRLRSKFEDNSADEGLHAAVVLIRHMIDCVAELRGKITHPFRPLLPCFPACLTTLLTLLPNLA
jgi:hypothetical protein